MLSSWPLVADAVCFHSAILTSEEHLNTALLSCCSRTKKDIICFLFHKGLQKVSVVWKFFRYVVASLEFMSPGYKLFSFGRYATFTVYIVIETLLPDMTWREMMAQRNGCPSHQQTFPCVCLGKKKNVSTLWTGFYFQQKLVAPPTPQGTNNGSRSKVWEFSILKSLIYDSDYACIWFGMKKT